MGRSCFTSLIEISSCTGLEEKSTAAPKNKMPCPARSPPPAALLSGYSHGRCGKSTKHHNKLTRPKRTCVKTHLPDAETAFGRPPAGLQHSLTESIVRAGTRYAAAGPCVLCLNPSQACPDPIPWKQFRKGRARERCTATGSSLLQKHTVKYLFVHHPVMQTGELPCGRRRDCARRVP